MISINMRLKILLTLIIATVITVMLSVTMVLRTQKHQMLENTILHLHDLMRVVNNALTVALPRETPCHINAKLRDLVEGMEVSGVLSLQFRREPVENQAHRDSLLNLARQWRQGRSLPIPGEISFETRRPGLHTLVHYCPVRNGPRCQGCHDPGEPLIGYIRGDFNLTEMDRQLSANRSRLLIYSLATTLLIFLAISLVHVRYVRRSLNRFLGSIREVEKGNLETEIPITAQDELGTLARSFNDMLQHISEMRRRMQSGHQQQLEKAGHLASIGELAAGMAHEIKNPIAGISGAITVIMNDLEENDPRRPVFREILRQVRRVDEAINNLLTYARPKPLQLRETKLQEVLDSALKIIRQMAPPEEVEIRRTGTSDLPPVKVDPVQLEQVLVNLFMNALQAMNHHGTLTVDQNRDPHSREITISVADTGPGIPPEQLEKIFQPFFTTRHKGTGLGLAICRGILERHGGRITVSSEPGRGSVFTIILPLDDSTRETKP